MFKRFLAAALLAAVCCHAAAAVDVNSADEAALRSLNGIGPAKARAILDERAMHGPFKNVADLSARVKGLGGHLVERLQADGLAVGTAGSSFAMSDEATHSAPGSPARAAAMAVKR